MRAVASLCFAAVMTFAGGVSAQIFPYDIDVLEGSPNTLSEFSAGSCDPTQGCFDSKGSPCKNNPGKTCDLARVPLGRCSLGTSSCVWPQGGGFCSANSAIACLPNSGTSTGPSSMCPSNGTCDMSTNDPTCACNGALPANHPTLGEAAVCAGLFARCSDGDPLRAFRGKGTSNCTENGIGGTSQRAGCGDIAGKNRNEFGPRWQDENPTVTYTPQREPGGGISPVNARPMRPFRSTTAMQFGAPDQFGVRTVNQLGDSFWQEVEFQDSLASGTLSLQFQSFRCDPPFGWQTERVVNGTCASPPADRFCTTDTDCVVGQCNYLDFCLEDVREGRGFVFTENLDPNEIAAAGRTNICPPDCFRDYDFDSYEAEAINAVGFADPDAGRQIALNHLGGRKVKAGTALSILVQTTLVWVPQADMRCYLGGDPFRANPADSKIGRCSGSPTPCATNGNCQGVEMCRFCGGTHSSDPEYGALASSLSAADAAKALPPRYNTHGHSALDLMAPGGDPTQRRLGLINGVPSTLRTEAVSIQTTGIASAQNKDHTCPGAPDFCELGQVQGGPPGVTTAQQRHIANVGIGKGGTFTQGSTFPAGGTCCDTESNITWRPQHPTTALTTLVQTSNYGPGPDGIPGCFGDNDPASNGQNACNEKLGDPNFPGNTGSDDVAIQYPNPNLAGNPLWAVFDPNGPPTLRGNGGGYVAPPNAAVEAAFPGANLPTVNLRVAGTTRDLEVLVPDAGDTHTKQGITWCPLVGANRECSPPDIDGDGIDHADDNCPYVANANQQDTGGIGNATPDGIGNVCQCGDITNNGIVNGQDGTFITRHALGYNDPLFVDGGKCDVTGNGLCNGQDGTFTTRAGLGYLDPPNLAPRGQNCHNADPTTAACPTCSPCPNGTCS